MAVFLEKYANIGTGEETETLPQADDAKLSLSGEKALSDNLSRDRARMSREGQRSRRGSGESDTMFGASTPNRKHLVDSFSKRKTSTSSASGRGELGNVMRRPEPKAVLSSLFWNEGQGGREKGPDTDFRFAQRSGKGGETKISDKEEFRDGSQLLGGFVRS